MTAPREGRWGERGARPGRAAGRDCLQDMCRLGPGAAPVDAGPWKGKRPRHFP